MEAAINFYPYIKGLHMTAAVVSGLGFLTRGVLVQMNHPIMARKWIRIAPHVNDTILLACAIWLAWFIHQFPMVNGWLTAKLFALVAYVVLGVFALRKAASMQTKRLFFGMALACYGYIILVALKKSPLPFIV